MTESSPNQESAEEQAREVIEAIRPYIQADGGDIEYVGMDDGVVQVRLQGACTGCPHAAMTLQMGVERNLKARIPDIKGVVNVG